MMNPVSTVRRLAGDARTHGLRLSAWAAGVAGRRCLDRKGTLDKLVSLGVRPDHAGCFCLNENNLTSRIEVLSSGVVRIGGRDCLDTDYGSRGALRGWTGRSIAVDRAAVLWSHRWMGYYHWLIDVAPKIAAIQASTAARDGGWRWIFPRSGQSYETETLDMLGLSESEVIDSRRYRSVRVRSVSMVSLPGWFEIQPGAALLRQRLLPHGGDGVGERIYLKRRGRRVCVNEDEVIRLLAPRGFVMVEDEPRSVADQIGIFRNAKVIVAPHGAALSNLLWCSRDSLVIECFAAGYCPPYYENLAAFTGMAYDCTSRSAQSHWTAVGENIRVDVNKLAACLERHGVS